MALHQKKWTILILASVAIIATSASMTPVNRYKNLQVLPKDISEHKLDSIMNAYTKALKVSCDFCHIPAKDIFNINPAGSEPDFASDNPMKENARKMIRLTIEINTKYFYFDSLVKPAFLNAVSCNTCHRGNPFPLQE